VQLSKKYKNFIFYELNVTVFEDVLIWISQFTGGVDNENK